MQNFQEFKCWEIGTKDSHGETWRKETGKCRCELIASSVVGDGMKSFAYGQRGKTCRCEKDDHFAVNCPAGTVKCGSEVALWWVRRLLSLDTYMYQCCRRYEVLSFPTVSNMRVNNSWDVTIQRLITEQTENYTPWNALSSAINCDCAVIWKLLKALPSGSGRDAVPREFQNLQWLNPHIAHSPSSTNLRSETPAGTLESSSSPTSVVLMRFSRMRKAPVILTLPLTEM